jgi:hypothetical protein
MRDSRNTLPQKYAEDNLLRALRFTLWAVPTLMAAVGLAYTLFEHLRHRCQQILGSGEDNRHSS